MIDDKREPVVNVGPAMTFCPTCDCYRLLWEIRLDCNAEEEVVLERTCAICGEPVTTQRLE